MSNKRVLAGVMPVELYDGNQNLICVTNSLTDEGLNATVENDDIRGGSANQLLSKYYYNSSLKLNMVDALFSLEYLALKVGATIEMGSDVQKSETITVTEKGVITPTTTPVAFPNTNKIVGSYKLSYESEDAWRTVEFHDGKLSVPDVNVGDKVCLKYFYADASSRKLVVPTNIIPSTVYAVAKIPEFNAGTDDISTKSQVGVLQVVIPKLIMEGNAELAVTSTGHATMNLAGEALAVSNGSCDGSSYYAILTETSEGGDEFTDAKAIVVTSSDVDLKAGETQTLEVVALYNGMVAPKPLDNSKLTFTSLNTSVATVTNGVVNAVAKGDATIEVTVARYPKLVAVAHVTVA